MERTTTAVCLLLGMLLGAAYMVLADPTGATILSSSTSGTPSASAGSSTTARGTITTVVLSSVQQDQQWKAYVGNVSGRLSLDDASGSTIYDWSLTGSISGEVYVTHASAFIFSNVSCADTNNISAEQVFFNMTDSQSDGINRTFNATNHAAFFVGTQSIAADTCRSTATYRNDTAQFLDGTQRYDEILLQDNASQLVYVTLIDDDVTGYNNNPYDFQIIVPESDVNVTSTTYYFFTELSG